jgi:hypothetical protein
MMTAKDLFDSEELMNSIVEDIDDIPEDAEVIYSVWALGHDSGDAVTDVEYLIGEFDNPDEAVERANKVTTAEMLNEIGSTKSDGTAYFSIEVETVVGDPDDEDCGTMNIGTIYRRALWIDGEYGSEEDAPDYGEDIVTTCAGDYELLDDGTLKLSAKFMKGFNKNDIIRVQFIDENSTYPLPYKIMSKVEYADGDYYHCELMI